MSVYESPAVREVPVQEKLVSPEPAVHDPATSGEASGVMAREPIVAATASVVLVVVVAVALLLPVMRGLRPYTIRLMLARMPTMVRIVLRVNFIH